MIYSATLNKEFETKKKLFFALKKNETRLINLKKSIVHKSMSKGQFSPLLFAEKTNIQKSISNFEEGFYYPVINTTRYLDSHDDVHFDGIWNKTIREQQGKIYYVNSHKLDIQNVIAYPENVEVFTQMLDWSSVGKNYAGKTEALIFKIAKDKIELDEAKKVFEQQRKLQGSVSMIYVKIKLGIDSDEKDFRENKEYFEQKSNLIVNQDRLKEVGYFFGVEEARIYKEGSMVIAGSNDATEIIYNENKIIEPSNDTQIKIDTQIEPSNYEKLLQTLKF